MFFIFNVYKENDSLFLQTQEAESVHKSVLLNCREEFINRPSFSQDVRQEMKTDFSVSELAGFRKRGVKNVDTTLIQQGVGNWEKHTKGIGAKLLLKVRLYEIIISLSKILMIDNQNIFLIIRWVINQEKGLVKPYKVLIHQLKLI